MCSPYISCFSTGLVENNQSSRHVKGEPADGLDPAPAEAPGLERATIAPYEHGEPGAFYYQRYGHPTQTEAESMLGALDGGHALLFGSGTGAATALVLAFCSPGKTIALAEGCYFGTSVLFQELGRWGLRYVEFDQTGPPPAEADLIWLEAPSNPFLTMPDFEAAAAHPAPVVRLDRCDPRVPAPDRARRRLRPAQRHEVPRRPLGRAPGRGRVRAARPTRSSC